MTLFTIKLPDVGEGVAEAELVEWNVAVGDPVREDDVLAAIMTDKATVEIPSSVAGTVAWIGPSVGDMLAVGADLVRIETDGDVPAPGKEERSATRPDDSVEAPAVKPVEVAAPQVAAKQKSAPPSKPARANGVKPLASPSVRSRAREAGIDLRRVKGTGKAGQVTHQDLDGFSDEDSHPMPANGKAANTSIKEIKVVGLRRKIAERMANAKKRIPHITIVEEVDVTALQKLRESLNAERVKDGEKLTILPFLMGGMVKALKEQPALNAHYDDENEVIREFGGVHIGIATQSKNGLMVPVVRHCETLTLWQAAAELARLAEAARQGTASREELSGSTITITSLGPLGAIATTPIINHPEVAIVGVNRIAVRPLWNGSEFVPRQMMNISCSFDHRVIDGWDAAVFVNRLKTLLETPAMIFVEG